MTAKLLMFEEPACEWCDRWLEEVGVVYHKTPEGRRAPLKRVMLYAKLPAEVRLKAPVTYTPTFVLLEGGQEVGRITGYPGEDFFWGYLGGLIAKLRNRQQSNMQLRNAFRGSERENG